MDVNLKKIYFGEEANLNIEFDKEGKTRPAWIIVKDAPESAQFLYIRINKGTPAYYVCWHNKTKIFLPTDPTPTELKRYYDKFSQTYDKFVEKRNLNEAEALLTKVLPLISKDINALELGAGTGQSTIPFAKAGYSVTLIELSNEMLNIAKTREELKNCTFICGDVRNINLNKKYDLIFSVNSFACATPYFSEHEMPELYKNIFNYLKPNGVIAMSGYDYEPPEKLFRKIDSGIYASNKSKHKYFIGIRC